MDTCINHPEREATSVCADCGAALCDDDLTDVDGRSLCAECAGGSEVRGVYDQTDVPMPIVNFPAPPAVSAPEPEEEYRRSA
jgi:hypothetical protein